MGNVISTEITYGNNLDRIETIRADGMIDGADPSIAALTGRTEVRFADSTLVSQAISGTPCELEFSYTLISGETLTVTVHAVYPAVQAYRDLLGDVRSILGAGTKIGYAADWSEYFGHQPADGSGDVFFHLDPLWADPEIPAQHP